MEFTKFSADKTGRLVEIDRANHPKKKDWAFIPDDLAETWQLAADLWPLLVSARERLGTLNGIGQTLPDPELLLRPLQSSEAMASSKIEGTFVTPEQLLMFEMDQTEPRTSTDKTADWQEVFNYNEALKTGCRMLESFPIGTHVIKSMHSVLMRGVRGSDKSPGEFRTCQVQIGSTARYIPPPWVEVSPLMQRLEEYINNESIPVDPLVKCFLVHYQFEAIHPFEDGNGRIGRALLAIMIHKLLGLSHPWLYLSAYFDKFQDEYFRNMFQVSATGNWKTWVEYCLNGTIIQSNDSISRCARFIALKEDFHARMKDRSPTPRSHMLIDNLFKNPIVRIASLKKSLNVHYATAKVDLEKLVEAGILRDLPGVKPKSYYASEIMHIAYGKE